MFDLQWSNTSLKNLKKLDDKTRLKIIDSTEIIIYDPLSHADKLKGNEYYKIRVGNYRIIIDINHEKKMIFVVKVSHRRNAYKK